MAPLLIDDVALQVLPELLAFLILVIPGFVDRYLSYQNEMDQAPVPVPQGGAPYPGPQGASYA